MTINDLTFADRSYGEMTRSYEKKSDKVAITEHLIDISDLPFRSHTWSCCPPNDPECAAVSLLAGTCLTGLAMLCFL